jgi:hypothetical protein
MWPKDRTAKAENSEDLDRKFSSLRDKEPYPNRRENDVKAPHVEGGSYRRQEKHCQQRRLRTRPEWAQACQPCPFWDPYTTPFDLDDPRAVYSPLAKNHATIHLSSAAEEQRS